MERYNLPILKEDEGNLIYHSMIEYVKNTKSDDKLYNLIKNTYDKYYRYAYYNTFLTKDDFISVAECDILKNSVKDYIDKKNDPILNLVGKNAMDYITKYALSINENLEYYNEIWEIRKLKDNPDYLNINDMVERLTKNWKGNFNEKEKSEYVKDYEVELNESKKNNLPTDTIKSLVSGLTEDAKNGDYWASCVKNNIETQINKNKER